MPQRFLAFDFGAESGRAIIATFSPDAIDLQEVHRFPTHQGRLQGTLQWNLLALWEEIKTGLRKAAATGHTFDGIGADTWGVDFGLLDSKGKVLGNPVHYRDSRTDGVMESVLEQVGPESLYNQTGIQFMFFNTLFQLAALKSQGLPQEAIRLLFMPDLFHYLLSGRAANELTIASTSAMIDPRTRRWAQPLLKQLGLPEGWLTEIVPPGTRLGTLLPAVAADTGLAPNTPVIAPATHDTASAIAAVPVTQTTGDWAYLSSGTWSLLGVETDQPILSSDALRLNYTNELGAGNKVRFLKNIMGLWLVQETRRDLARRGTELDYPELTRLAGGEKGLDLLMSSWHPPLARPGDFLQKIDEYAAATNQLKPAGPGGYVRACLDSLALSYRTTLDDLEHLTSKKITTLHIVGGGTKNELLNQMTADATGRTVIAGPTEATAIGNALTQALGSGALASLAAARALVAKSFPLKTYRPQNPAPYEKALPRFRELCSAS